MSDALHRAREIHQVGCSGNGYDDMGDAYRAYQEFFDVEIVGALLDVAETIQRNFEKFPDDYDWLPDVAEALATFEQKVREQE